MNNNKKLLRTLSVSLVTIMLLGALAFGALAETPTQDATFALASSTDRQELSVKEIAKKCIPSVVTVSTETTVTYYNSDSYNPFGSFYGYGYGYGYGNGQDSRQKQEVVQSATGTGIIMSEDGYIVTNNHVIEGADKITIVLSDESEYEAKLIGASADDDIAVLKIETAGLTPATFGDSQSLEIGDEIVAIGNALGKLPGTTTRGIISFTARETTIDDVTINALQFDAAVNSGNSGGPLINSYGEVIGIVYAKGSDLISDGIGYAIPIDTVKDLITTMINDPESVAAQTAGSQIMLGITGYSITEEMMSMYGLPAGVYVKEVSEFSAAERAGLGKGDIITSFAGQEVTDMDSLNAIKGEQTSGSEVTVGVDRNSRQIELTLVIPQPTTVTE